MYRKKEQTRTKIKEMPTSTWSETWRLRKYTLTALTKTTNERNTGSQKQLIPINKTELKQNGDL